MPLTELQIKALESLVQDLRHSSATLGVNAATVVNSALTLLY